MQFNPNMYMNYEDTGDAAPMVRAAPVKTGPSDALIKQILGSNSDKWTGQGYGSAQANAADMAKILSGIGITDISQFGQLPDGSYGNKVTGQAVPNTYSERQTGNAWGGTFQGKGNTGYRVSFDAQGNPQFYTTGASSSDVPSWVAPALAIGGLAFGIPGLSELITGAGGAIGNALTGAFGAEAAGGMTAAELAQANMALGGVGGTAGAAELGSALATGAPTVATTALTGGSGLVTGANAGITADSVAAQLAADSAGTPLASNAGTPLANIANTAPVAADGTPLSSISNTAPAAPSATPAGTSIADMTTPNALSDGFPSPSATPGEIAPQENLGSNPAQGIKPSAAPNVGIMDGGQGIIASTSAGIDNMGGATGILAPAAGGGVLSAGGVNTGANIAGNIGAGVNAINTGVGNIGSATSPITPGGSKISDLLSGLSPAQIASLGSGLLGAIGGINTNSAINNAQGIQSAAAQKSLGTLGDIYGKNMESIAPYQQTGQGALGQINQQMPYFTHQFDANDLNANLAPNYQFMLGQGQMANQRAANVGGGALSGNTLQGLNAFTQNYAGNAYQNAFNNYNTQRNNIANTLSGIAGLGSTANQQGIGAGTSYGQNVTNLNTGLAAAQAAATIGKAQNTSNTISNLGNAGFLASLLGQSSGISNADSAINPYFAALGG